MVSEMWSSTHSSFGGGTTKIGDPSGKDSARPVLEKETIENNKNALKIVFANYLNFEMGLIKQY